MSYLRPDTAKFAWYCITKVPVDEFLGGFPDEMLAQPGKRCVQGLLKKSALLGRTKTKVGIGKDKK